jgi:hypothetical protein
MIDSMKHAAEDEAIKMALGLSPDSSGSSNSKDDFDVVEIPPDTLDPSLNTVEQLKDDSQEVKSGIGTGKKEPAATAEKASAQIDQELDEMTPKTTKNTTIAPIPLVLYAYSESETARPNLEFFIRHALNDAADFVFILNGFTDANSIIPNLPNIRIVQRDNDCYDLGAYAEVLQRDDLWKGYGKFIMLNASLRGPFMPYWSDACWMDMYLRKLTEEVKVTPPSLSSRILLPS